MGYACRTTASMAATPARVSWTAAQLRSAYALVCWPSCRFWHRYCAPRPRRPLWVLLLRGEQHGYGPPSCPPLRLLRNWGH
jgi:hypothetical protein